MGFPARYDSFDRVGLGERGRPLPKDNVTGKRVKGVFSTQQAIHVWAQRTQTSGQNGKGNVYFIGDTLYDYGSHFINGQFVTNSRGEVACVFNSKKYGTTTSEHQGMAWRAVSDSMPKFATPDVGLDHAENLAYFAAQIQIHDGKAKRARKDYSRDWEARMSGELAEQAKAYCAFFNIPGIDGVESIIAAGEVFRAKERAAQKKLEAKQRREVAKDVKAWLTGAKDHCPLRGERDARGGVLVRIKGDRLQTAAGAEVPLRHAVKVFQFVKQCRETKTAWKRNGHTVRVGHFQVDSIEANGDFVAGCHKFTWETIAAAAKQARVFSKPASAEAVEVTAN